MTLCSFGQYQFTHYTTYNTGNTSLGSNTIHNIVENPDNQHLYFSSHDLIMEYDGVDFIPRYDIFNPVLFSYLEKMYFDIDAQGNLWYEYWDTLRSFNGTSFSQYLLPQTSASNSNVFCDSQGNVWIGTTSQGVYKYDGVNLSQYHSGSGLVGDLVNHVFEDSQGNIWISTNHGVSMYNGTTWTGYDAGIGFQWSNNLSNVSCIGEDANGTIWACGYQIAYLNGSSWTFLDPATLTNSPGTEYNVCVMINDTVNDRLWFGSTQQGVFYKENSNWFKHTTSEGAPSDRVSCGMIDSQGAVWFGYYFGGLSNYKDSVWTNISTNSGLAENWTYDIHESSENEIWVGSIKSVSRLSSSQWTNYFGQHDNDPKVLVDSDFDNHVCVFENHRMYRHLNNNWDTIYCYSVGGSGLTLLSESSDNYWTAGWSGAMNFYGPDFWNQSNWIGYTNGLPHNYCTSLERDSSGVLWIGTYAGVAYLQGSNWVQVQIPHDDFGDRIYDLTTDFHGNLWVCSEYGVACKTNTSWEFYFESDGLANNYVWDAEIASDSTVWFATIGGVSVKTDTGLYSIHESDGLIHRHARCLEEDHEGNMWIGTQHGVCKLHNAVPLLHENNIANNFDFKIYPIPAKNILYVEIPETNYLLEVYNNSGMMVIREKVESGKTRVDISRLPMGNYVIRGLTSKTNATGKFVIVR